eukprot:4464636-Amphidinium_carterae.1
MEVHDSFKDLVCYLYISGIATEKDMAPIRHVADRTFVECGLCSDRNRGEIDDHCGGFGK